MKQGKGKGKESLRENQVEESKQETQEALVSGLGHLVSSVHGHPHSHALTRSSQVTVFLRKKEGDYEVQQQRLGYYLPHLDFR